MRYMVTGATGFIGSQVTRQLCQAGHQVVAVVRRPKQARDLAALGVELHAGDITDKESLRAPMQGMDGVFHIAAWYKIGAKDKSMAYQINVEGTRNVLNLARELRIPKTVYTSTLGVFGDTHGQVADETFYQGAPWLSEYERTKWLAHYEVASPMTKAGLPLVIVLSGLVYGPGDTSTVRPNLVQYLKRRLPMLPLQTAYCWGFVDDVARGHILAMEKGRSGESYIIAGPAHTLVEAFEIAEKLTSIPAPRYRLSPAILNGVAACMRAVEKVFPVPEIYSYESLHVMAGPTYVATSAKAQRELGFSARPLADGLRETLDYEMKLLGMKPA
jgi:nucleoside-diphosphate-sugar epimerase